VTGAVVTSTIPTPTTSPVLIGELPSKKSPCEEDIANTDPFVDNDDWVATHQFITYLPDSLNVTKPVTLL